MHAAHMCRVWAHGMREAGIPIWYLRCMPAAGLALTSGRCRMLV